MKNNFVIAVPCVRDSSGNPFSLWKKIEADSPTIGFAMVTPK